MAFPEPLLTAVLALPERDRAELALHVINSLDAPADEDAEGAWAEEVTGRVEALERGQAEVIPFESALREARERVRSRRHG